MNNIYNRVQTKPVGMPIPPALQAQYLKETFGLTDEEIAELGKRHQENEAKRKLQQ